MKTTLSFLTAMLFSGILLAQTTAIPDSMFEKVLISLGYDSGTPDGVVLTANIDTVTALGVANRNISDLTGIEDFTAIEYLYCPFNYLTSLDISNNTALAFLDCSFNSLTFLDIRNGNNINMTRVWTFGNTNLFCIMVDDPYSSTNWPSSYKYSKDSLARYTNGPCNNKISGIAYYDKDISCTQEGGEQGVPHAIIKAIDSSEIYTITNNTGYFELWLESNISYQISMVSISNMNLLNGFCPTGGHAINSGPDGTDTKNIDFGLDIKYCALPSVDVSMARLRRCFKNNASITYRNDGTAAQINAEIFVDFPEHVKLVSASKSYTVVDANEGIYKFNIDTIQAFSQGSISIVDSVICGNEDIRGYTQCIKAWITPKSNCAETKDTTTWDKSSIMVLGTVQCLGDTIARFTISNYGSGDMLSAHKYRFYYDNELAYTGTFQLNAGDSLVLDVTADGSTIRLEADQHPLHPGKSKPRTTIEGCGSVIPSKAFLGFWTQAPNDDLDYDVSEKCLIIRDSYDPNDKKVSPLGITNEHYVPESEALNYTIRFQNTGNDTAYLVRVKDTLSDQLNLATLHVTGASHNYKYEVSGEDVAVLSFTFENINLPDSTTYEAGSHGFVSFSISPVDSITPGTSIENFADIYFDFNSAIRTDTAAVIALDTTISSNKTITVNEISTSIEITKGDLLNISIFPNPSNDYIIVKGSNDEFNRIRIYDVTGKLIIEQRLSAARQQEVNIASLEAGSYFIHVVNENGVGYVFKMVK